jgi:2-phosphosulfolactate phosphatase
MQDPRFNQDPYRCRVEWGRRAAHDAAVRGDIVVVVDVLRFRAQSTRHHGAGRVRHGHEARAIELGEPDRGRVLPRDTATR